MFRDRYRCALRTFPLLLLVSIPASALAEPVLFTGSGTNSADVQQHSLSASALFETYTDVSGTYLKVTLTNTYAPRYDAIGKIVPSDVLTGLFFDVVGNPTLSLVTALVVAPNKILNPDTGAGDAEAPPTGLVTGGWQYKHATSGLYTPDITQQQGLGTAGLGIFNGNDVGDVNYGIVNKGYLNGDGNKPVYTNRVIRNAVVFTLTGLSAGFNPKTDVSSVRFQYGTDLKEQRLVGHPTPTSHTPEPSTLVLSSLAFVGLVAWRRGQRRRRPSRSDTAE